MTDVSSISRPKSIDPRAVLAQVETFVRSYCVFPEDAYLPVSLWVIASYLPDCFDCFPYLAFVSPLKQCGKTRALEVCESLSRGAWRGTTPTPAALYRMMGDKPTLLLDEIEALSGRSLSETQQALVAIFNAGHRKGATVPRCQPKTNIVEYYPVYGPKAFAGIGELPSTLNDRSIRIQMQRKTKGQKVERWLTGRVKTQVEPICRLLKRFAAEFAVEVENEYRAAMDGDLDSLRLSDREIDIWLPLFAVCAVVAPQHAGEVRRSAELLYRLKQGDDTDDTLATRLLSDLRENWPDDHIYWETTHIVQTLSALVEAPWSDSENRLTPFRLARMLRGRK